MEEREQKLFFDDDMDTGRSTVGKGDIIE